MTERVLVVGTGLIGGSVGLALRARGVEVVGHDRDAGAGRRAKERGAVVALSNDLESIAATADVIVVATPVGQIERALATVATSARPGTVVTDVGSTKGPIVAAAESLLGPHRPFVGGHPMAGTEGEGIEAARADLFEGALWILTPTPTTDAGGFRRVNALVHQLGAKTLALDPAEHDRLVARVSHVPYAVATALMGLAAESAHEGVFQAAAGSFRDVTRIAGSNPRMWRDILIANRGAVLDELDALLDRLGDLRTALREERWDAIDRAIDGARTARARFPLKGERGPAQPVTIELAIRDRSGVLADVTTAMGEAGINIEDLRMDHTAAGGVVHLVVDGRSTALRASELLSGRGYRPTLVEDT